MAISTCFFLKYGDCAPVFQKNPLYDLHLFLWPSGEISQKKTLHIGSGEVPQLPWKEKISQHFRRLNCLSDQHP
jgi:hypothetical protein